jgi:carbon monoxide dehydrogenase subunit G
MGRMKIEATVDLPPQKVWEMFINPQSYTKYFKYIKKVFYKGKMKKGYVWFDLATVVYFPFLVLHKVTVFEEGKVLEFKAPFPFIGQIIERVEFSKHDRGTLVKANIEYDYGPIFGFLFNNMFERRFREMIEEGIAKAKKDFEQK